MNNSLKLSSQYVEIDFYNLVAEGIKLSTCFKIAVVIFEAAAIIFGAI